MSTTAIDESKRLKAYNTKRKQRDVPMYNVKINKIVNGNFISYIAKGTTQDGADNLAVRVSAVKADEVINAGVASRGTGWE